MLGFFRTAAVLKTEKSWLLWILRAVTGFLSKVQSIGVIILFFWLFKSTIRQLIEKVRRRAQRISTFPLTARELFMDLQTRPGGLLTFCTANSHPLAVLSSGRDVL